jgi:glutamate racemase
MAQHPIGVFDSGYGGLTILKELVQQLPAYDYLYLGDNARAPYGNRSFDTVFEYTWEAVQWFFNQGCPLVLLACNTASAKALRTIQQKKLPQTHPQHRVLGVIRPTTEVIGHFSPHKAIGILGTSGTVSSQSYTIEMAKFWPDVQVFQEACPMWVPLVENNEHEKPGANYFIAQHLDALLAQSANIDAILLACTHYPLLQNKIEQHLEGKGIKVLSQGKIVAESLADYLSRHPQMDGQLTRNGQKQFYTTDSAADFDKNAGIFYGQPLQSQHVDLLAAANK